LDGPGVDDGHKQGVSSDERRELAELRRKNRVLEMQVEILKAASGYYERRSRGRSAPC
jgi:transposase